MGLSTLPYDLLLNIAFYLNLKDIHALHLTCKTLNDFTTTRPVYRKLATDLLRKCRALPLKGFQRLTDLTTEELIRSVNQAARYDNAWRRRAPRPIGRQTTKYGTSHYMDGPSHSTALTTTSSHPQRTWYKVVSAPPAEEVDWLSPITSSYTLCATKSGKVVCWDVQSDSCLAEWNPGERWELWKCRVEFEERTVYFTMAKILDASQDDSRIMEFVLMRLTFSDPPSGESSTEQPVFSRVTEFRTTGVVMNIFLLDPSERLLSAFVWVASSNTIGLYALLDWSKPEYVFIDTGIDYAVSANWSCILYDQHIVIHCEEPESARQYFYPFSLLRAHSAYLLSRQSHPQIIGRVPPARTLTKKFVFPRISLPSEPPPINPFPLPHPHPHPPSSIMDEDIAWLNAISPHMVLLLPSISPTQTIAAAQLTPVVASSSMPGGMTPGASSASSPSASSNNAVMATTATTSPISVGSPPQSSSQPVVLSSSSPSSLSSTSTSASSSGSASIPTPTAPLLSHATLPNFAHSHSHVHPQHTLPSPQLPTLISHPPHHHHPHLNSIPLPPPPPPLTTPYQNPFPFPTWYPESAHFVRQWWPSLPGIPRVSCTVVLLAMHDQETHRNRFVLAQHYFKVPIDWGMWVRGEGYNNTTPESTTNSSSDGGGGGGGERKSASNNSSVGGGLGVGEEREGDEDLMKMWYVSKPFEVVRVLDDREDDENQMLERPRPLVAVDFGHAVWIEYCDDETPSPPPQSQSQPLPLPLAPLSHHHYQTQSTIINPNSGSTINIQGGNDTPSGIVVAFHEDGNNDHDHDEDMTMTTTTPIPSDIGFFPTLAYDDDQDQDQEQDLDPKVLKFVTFPGYEDGYEEEWVEEEVEVEVEVEDESEDKVKENGHMWGKGKGKQQVVVDEDLDMDERGGGGMMNGKDKGKGKNKNGNTPYMNGSSSWAYTNGRSKTSSSSSSTKTTKPSTTTTSTTTTKKKKKIRHKKRRERGTEGIVRTLEVPDELDLGTVETINIDQSQGAVILSDREGKIFILCYE